MLVINFWVKCLDKCPSVHLTQWHEDLTSPGLGSADRWRVRWEEIKTGCSYTSSSWDTSPDSPDATMWLELVRRHISISAILHSTQNDEKNCKFLYLLAKSYKIQKITLLWCLRILNPVVFQKYYFFGTLNYLNLLFEALMFNV